MTIGQFTVLTLIVLQSDVLCQGYTFHEGLKTTVEGLWKKFPTSFRAFIRTVLESLRTVYSFLSKIIRFRREGTREPR